MAHDHCRSVSWLAICSRNGCQHQPCSAAPCKEKDLVNETVSSRTFLRPL